MRDLTITSKLFPLVSGRTNITKIIPAKDIEENKNIKPCIPSALLRAVKYYNRFNNFIA